MFGSGGDEEPVGEIWYSHPHLSDAELMVKYLFTSERLSIQVHPDDDAARLRGLPRGKDEAWVILAADSGAEIGIGTRYPVDRQALRAAAIDGSIEQLLAWHPVQAGDVFYSPAGMIHAIGAGLTLVEIQQNVDVTYRLYDYGRPRELHLEEAIAVANAVPYTPSFNPIQVEPGREILVKGRAFVIERWTSARSGTLQPPPERPLWLVAISGGGCLGPQSIEAGAAWIIDGSSEITLDDGADLLLAYSGPEIHHDLLRARA
jgi:mannose-6-phosphate isomerase